jgi:hypothetical protein
MPIPFFGVMVLLKLDLNCATDAPDGTAQGNPHIQQNQLNQLIPA